MQGVMNIYTACVTRSEVTGVTDLEFYQTLKQLKYFLPLVTF